MTDLTQDLLDIVQPWIIGIWNYRKIDAPVGWTATYCFDGEYRDTPHYETVAEALDRVRVEVALLQEFGPDANFAELLARNSPKDLQGR